MRRGFHDPVLTDRGFITEPKKMLRGYLGAGAIAAAFIVLFGLIGVHAHVTGLSVGEDAPLRVAKAFGVSVLAGMNVMMMLSAGSTLDSTLSSFSKAVVQDLGGAATRPSARRTVPLEAFSRWVQRRDSVRLGRWVMVVTIVIGSLPLYAGTEILKATTLSGTMVLGLAPVFMLWFIDRAGPLAFHLAFWPGVVVGVVHAAGLTPAWLAVGSGDYAELLGTNLAGCLIVFAGFGVGTLLDGLPRLRAR